MPLSVLSGERRPGDYWSSRDAQLATALTQLEAQLCPGCGQPQWLAFDPAQNWEVDDEPDRCHPCTAREGTAQRWLDANTTEKHGPEVPSALRWAVRPYTEN